MIIIIILMIIITIMILIFFSKSEEKIDTGVRTVLVFSTDIRMEFGMKKYGILTVN